MRRAKVLMNGVLAGILIESEKNKSYEFSYEEDYDGPPISLTMPLSRKTYSYDTFPPFFDGLLPEGAMLEGLLRQRKLDRDDLFGQLVTVGQDLVGAVTVEELE